MTQYSGGIPTTTDTPICRVMVGIPLYVGSWLISLYTHCYAMIAGISHDMAFGMCHLGCQGILHDHVVCVLTMQWYTFSKPQKTSI